MKFKSFLLLFLVSLLFFSNIGLSKRDYSVGVSPGIINLGDLETDTAEVVTFFIITPSEESLLVELEPVRGSLDFFNRASYKDLIFNFSEEDVTMWVNLINNPVELKPSNETLQIGSGIIKGQREISFVLEIPKDADSGYHLLSVNPIPRTPPGVIGGVGTRVVAITAVNVLFNVVGDAIREGKILDVEKSEYKGDRLELKTYFQNTGTTTVSAKATQKIYDINDEFVIEIPSSREYFTPNEIRDLKTYLPTSNLALGEYKVYTLVDYTTGSVMLNSTINLTIPPPPKPEEEFMPWLLIILVLVLIVLFVIYRRMK